jgi:hypothetical protein
LPQTGGKLASASRERALITERDCFQTRLLSYVSQAWRRGITAIARFSPASAPLLGTPLGVECLYQAMAFVCQMGETSDERRPNSR